jgi:tRNA-2-methylthio-N6-dimethylallyladenosine synthase
VRKKSPQKKKFSDTLCPSEQTAKARDMKASIYIETLGCQMNVADSERASTKLRGAGYELVDSSESADVVIFNTCSVRARAAQKVFNRIGEVRKARNGNEPTIGVMGCVAQLEGSALFDHSSSINLVVGTAATDRLPSLIESARQSQQQIIDVGERAGGELWKVSNVERHSPYVAFVPIIEGCNKFCSYCIVPFSRGREQSRVATEILDEVRRLREDGFKEVHLIGQNVNSYRPLTSAGLEGFSGTTPFSKLLRAVAATGMKRIKFTTSFPRDFHADIVAAMEENENLCNWVHLPAQSGSDRVLRAMRRGYKREDYLRRVAAIKSSRRRIALTSDIIIGFPGETAEEFEETMSLVEQCQYDGLYMFKYSERPGTPASELTDNVSNREKASRFSALEILQKNLQGSIYKSYIGREINVLVEGESAKSNADMSGHSTCHKVINFPGDMTMVGQEVSVTITEAKANSLYGVIKKN